MPYSGASDPSLPSNVKKLSTQKKRQWVNVFNSVMSKTKDEGKAFAAANAAVQESEVTEDEVAEAVWSTATMNDLPDSAFLYVESGGKKDADGKTTPRSLRHFPYKGADGKIDLPHLRNAIARIPQSGISSSLKTSLQARARKLLSGQQSEEEEIIEEPEDIVTEQFFGSFPGSFDDTLQKVRGAIQGAINDEADISVLYKDSAVIQKNGKYFQYNYSVDESGDILLGAASEVVPKFVAAVKRGPGRPPIVRTSTASYALEQELVFETVQSEFETLTDQDDSDFVVESEVSKSDGNKWNVTVLRSGVSANKFEYTQALLKKSVHLYEGVRAYADHPGLTEIRDRRGNRSIRDLVGFYSNIRYEESGSTAKLKGVLNLVEGESVQWLRDLLRTSTSSKHPIVGLSHSIEYKKSAAESKEINGQVVTSLEEIDRVVSVDIVGRPSAGGEFDSQAEQVEERQVYKTLAELKADKPKIHEALMNLQKRDWDLYVLQAEAYVEDIGEKPAPEKQEETKPVTEEAKTTVVTVNEQDDRLVKMQAQMEQMQIASCQSMLTARLAEYPKMPARLRDRVKEHFEGKVFESSELDSEIKFAKEIWADIEKSSGKTVLSEGLADPSDSMMHPREKVVQGIDAFFLDDPMNRQVLKDKEGHRVKPFKSIRQMYAAWEGEQDVYSIDPRTIFSALSDRGVLGKAFDSNLHVKLEEDDNGVTDVSFSRIMEDITSASFGEVWADRLYKKFLRDYIATDASAIWRLVVSEVGSVTDFRTHRQQRWGGYGTLVTVPENTLYPDATTPDDEEVTYQIEKYGKLERLTFESITNDDMGLIRKIPGRLARAANETLFRAVMDLISGGFAGTIYDGTPLFTVGHANLLSGAPALSHSSLSAARAAMRVQSAYGEPTAILGWTPRRLLVPTGLEDVAFRLTNSNVYGVVTVPAENTTTPNIHNSGESRLEHTVVDYWTDQTNWFALADPAIADTIGVYFLNGREQPELFVADNPTEGDNLKYDRQTYKVRHIFDTIVLDHRAFQGSAVAG